MPLFHSHNRHHSPRSEAFYATVEIVYTVVDFAAAIAFLIGSILFFWESTQIFATWLFVIGSVCFCLKPTIRLWREIKLVSMGQREIVAKRAMQ